MSWADGPPSNGRTPYRDEGRWGGGWSILSSQAVEYQPVQTAPALLIKLALSHTLAHSCNHRRITPSNVISLKDREL